MLFTLTLSLLFVSLCISFHIPTKTAFTNIFKEQDHRLYFTWTINIKSTTYIQMLLESLQDIESIIIENIRLLCSTNKLSKGLIK